MSYNIQIGDRLREARTESNITLQDIATEMGVARSTIQRYEAGIVENIKLPMIEAIANYLNVNPAWLACKSDIKHIKSTNFNPLTPHEQTHITKYRACDERGKEVTDRILDYEYNRCVGNTKIVEFPEIKSLSLELYRDPSAAGYGNYLTEDSYHETVDFSVADVPQGTDYAVTISGDSMEPEILNGSIAFIKCCPCVDSGDIGIFLLNGESFCKKFVYDENERVIQLVSLNPDYNPIPIGPDDDLRVLGKVLGVYEED